MAQKSSKTNKALNELKELVAYAKEAKLMRVKVEGYEFELHPLALQEGVDYSMPTQETLEQLETRIKNEALKESEDILFYSSNSGRNGVL